jgi:hypothetical protein
MRHSRHPQKGSLILVVLCLLAVLGIGLAAFLAVGDQSMKLSNRSFQTGLSSKLAEMGLSEALRAFNTNNWATWTNNGTTATWSISGNTASCTITLPSTKYGSSGVTGSVKIRVDNYNAFNLPSTWSSGTSYRVNDLVGSIASPWIWYRCIANHSSSASNQPSNTNFWAETPIPWAWDSYTTYSQYDVVNVSGIWYRVPNNVSFSGSSQMPPSANWVTIPALSLPWNNTTPYSYTAPSSYSFAYSGGVWYRYVNTTTTSGNSVSNGSYWTSITAASPYFSWRYGSSTTYQYNDLVYRQGVWYRSILSGNSGHTPSDTSPWEDALAHDWNWSSSASYNINDAVYSSGSWYRCILAHANQQPPNATYWSTAPLKSTAWDSGRNYNANDTVSYRGKWYLALSGVSPGQNPSTSTYWVDTTNATYQWNSSSAYTTSSYVSYDGVWYHCILANTGQTPNNATYWSALGAPVIYAQGTVTLPDGTSTIATQLRATVTTAPLFPNAIAATSTLIISGAGTVDSYDSVTDPNEISPGYSAVLAATGTTNPAVTVTSTTVKGYVAAPSASTTPYAPLFSYSSASLKNADGTVTSPDPLHPNIDLTRISRSPFIPQFSTQAVVQHSTIPSTLPSPLNLGIPGAATPMTYTYASSLSLASTININGPVILDIQGSLTINSGGTIVITTSGSAEIHVSGQLQVLAASGGINNLTLDPKKLILICTGNTGPNQYSANTTNPSYYGTIYMPNNSVTNTLTIGTGVVVYGALSAQNITFSSAANVHYDTSLRYATFHGVDTPYMISEWRELTDPSERAVLP